MVEHCDEAVKAAKEAIKDYMAVHKFIQAVNKKNDELYRINLTISSRFSDAPTSRQRRMADSPKFNGDREKLRNFKVQLRLKLVEESSFRTEVEKTRYIISLLEGPAMD